MAYRDRPVDPRVAALLALIAAEPDVRAQLVGVRREQNAQTEVADVVGPQLWEAESDLEKRREGGVIATVTGWFGRSIEDHEAEVVRLRAQHTDLTAKIEALTSVDRALSAKLSAATGAVAELERLDVEAVDALRAADGSDGEAVRALDADDGRDTAQREAIERVLDSCDLARAALWTLDTIVQELRAVTGVASSVKIVFERIDSPLNTPSTVEDRQRVRARIAASIPYAAQRLDELVARYDRAGVPWRAAMPRQRVVQLAAIPPAENAEETQCVRNSEALVGCVMELIEGLVVERERIDRDRAAREARRRELAGRIRA